MRLDEAERDMESWRDDLAQAQDRIQTLLDVKGGSDDEDDGSLEATMAFDKVIPIGLVSTEDLR